MTCIAAVKTDDGVWMAGDSAGVAHLSIVTRADKKVFVKQDAIGTEFGFGFTSSFRMGQLIQYNFVIPVLTNDDIHEYMVATFIPALRTCLKDGGYTTIENAAESGGTFLVAVKGRLFSIQDDFQVGENLPPYSACGCGEDLALGSLYSTEKFKELSGEYRLKLALEAASEFSAGVRPPFNIIHVKP